MKNDKLKELKRRSSTPDWIPGTRPDKAEVQHRVYIIYELLIRGYNNRRIMQFIAQSTRWNINRRQTYNYISKAQNLFEESSKIVRSRELGKSIERLNLLFQKSLDQNEFNNALQTQKELNKLLALYETAENDTDRGKILEWIDNL